MNVPHYNIGQRVRVIPQTGIRPPFVGLITRIQTKDYIIFFYTVSGSVFLFKESELKVDHLPCGKSFKQLMIDLGVNYEQL